MHNETSRNKDRLMDALDTILIALTDHQAGMIVAELSQSHFGNVYHIRSRCAIEDTNKTVLRKYLKHLSQATNT